MEGCVGEINVSMIIENPLEKPETFLYAPERDFNEIEDGVKIIKEHFNLLD